MDRQTDKHTHTHTNTHNDENITSTTYTGDNNLKHLMFFLNEVCRAGTVPQTHLHTLNWDCVCVCMCASWCMVERVTCQGITKFRSMHVCVTLPYLKHIVHKKTFIAWKWGFPLHKPSYLISKITSSRYWLQWASLLWNLIRCLSLIIWLCYPCINKTIILSFLAIRNINQKQTRLLVIIKADLVYCD